MVFFLFCFFLPTQLGRHFFLSFSYLSGIRIDYLAPTLYLTDILAFLLILLYCKDVSSAFRKRFVWIVFTLLCLNFVFALSKPLFMYRLIKYIQWFSVFIIFRKHFFTYKKFIIAGLIASVIVQVPLVIGQLTLKRSLQGVWYLLGERYMTLSTPGIAKASLTGTEILRPYGTFSHPNSMAGFFLVLYIFFLTMFSKKQSLGSSLLLILCSFLVFFSFSKFALAVFVLLTIAWYIKKQELTCRICTLARIITPLFLAGIFFTAQTDPQSIQKRITLIGQSVLILSRHLLTGVGMGSYLIAQHRFPIPYPYFFLQPVHNIYLLFASEAGIILMCIFAYRFFFFIRSNMKNTAFVFVILAILLTGLNDHYWLTLQQNFLLMATVLGIVLYNKV